MTKARNIILIGLLIPAFFFLGCRKQLPDYQVTAENFVKTYYLQIDPAGALKFSRGPAAEKMHRELELLEGVSASKPEERPKLSYQIKSCLQKSPSEAHCDYELDIDAGRKIQRKGRLALHQDEERWWVIQFVEEQ